MKTLNLLWVLGAVAIGAGCSSNNIGVDANHAPLTAYKAQIGHVNTPAFELGDVVMLDPSTHTATKAASVQVEPGDVAFGQTIDSKSEPFDGSFELTFSQRTQPSMREFVQSQVRGQTALHIENATERKLSKPGAFAAGSEQLQRIVAKLHKQNPDAKFFLVSSVTGADKVWLSYAGATDGTIHDGKFEFHVSYSQNGELAKLAADKPVFFNWTPLAVTEKRGHSTVAVDKNFNESISDYSYTNQAVATTW
jgi:hypothetical protein